MNLSLGEHLGSSSSWDLGSRKTTRVCPMLQPTFMLWAAQCYSPFQSCSLSQCCGLSQHFSHSGSIFTSPIPHPTLCTHLPSPPSVSILPVGGQWLIPTFSENKEGLASNEMAFLCAYRARKTPFIISSTQNRCLGPTHCGSLHGLSHVILAAPRREVMLILKQEAVMVSSPHPLALQAESLLQDPEGSLKLLCLTFYPWKHSACHTPNFWPRIPREQPQERFTSWRTLLSSTFYMQTNEHPLPQPSHWLLLWGRASSPFKLPSL